MVIWEGMERGNDFDAKKYLKKLQLFVLSLGVAGLSFGIPLSYFVIPRLLVSMNLAPYLPPTTAYNH